MRRFSQLWEINADARAARRWSRSERGSRTSCRSRCRPPSSTATTGSATSWSSGSGPTASRPSSTGRWARSAIPAPTSATCSRHTREPGGGPSPLGVSPVTALEGFPTKAELVARYEERSGREVGPLGWFEALALWKAAVFCEAIYGRFMRGELAAEDGRAAAFEHAVPLMAETALARLVA